MSSTRSGDPRRALGNQGEAHAAQFLEGEGYRIVARNVRAGGVEIDLIVARGSWLAFVEVKTRSSARHGRPEEAVDERKQARIVRGARAWMADHPSRRRRRVRFDVVSVSAQSAAGSTTFEVTHIPAAFDAGGGY